MTDRKSLRPAGSTASLLHKIERVVCAGVDCVQIREKDLSAKELAALTRQALRFAIPRETRIVLNDRLDVALAERAGGVHLPENGLPVQEVKRLIQTSPAGQKLDANFWVGTSCHSIEAVLQAAKEGADYIFFGPIFATPAKEKFGPPQGLTRLRDVCHSVAIPVLAIGGITLENAASCIDAGAAGIAAIRLFQDADDPAHVLRNLHQILR